MRSWVMSALARLAQNELRRDDVLLLRLTRILDARKENRCSLFSELAGPHIDRAQWRIRVRGIENIVEAQQGEIGPRAQASISKRGDRPKRDQVAVADRRTDLRTSRQERGHRVVATLARGLRCKDQSVFEF